MPLLTIEDFLKNDDHSYEIVDLPRLGGSVKIRTLTGSEALKFETMRKEVNHADLILWLIVKCCVNEDNTPMFNEDHLTAIGNKSPESITKLFQSILDLNTVSDDKIKGEAKNS